MSTNKMSIAILEEFIKKIRLAIKSGQKEIKIPINEAENVVHNLNLITLRLLEHNDQEKEQIKNEVVNVVMDGGGFEEKR